MRKNCEEWNLYIGDKWIDRVFYLGKGHTAREIEITEQLYHNRIVRAELAK